MDLAHNSVFRVLDGDSAGLYRVVLDGMQQGCMVIVRLDATFPPDQKRRGRKKLTITKNTRKKAPAPLVGQLIWKDINELKKLDAAKHLLKIEVETETFKSSPADEKLYELRVEVMKGFLDFDTLRESILLNKGLGGLVDEAVKNSNSSRPLVYKLFSLLCRFGFYKSSLRPRHDRCGGKNVQRPCNPGGRQKAGAKTTKQRVARAYGEILPPDQPGMSDKWRHLIMTADRQIPTPKPDMPQRVIQILESGFVKKYKQEGNCLVAAVLNCA